MPDTIFNEKSLRALAQINSNITQDEIAKRRSLLLKACLEATQYEEGINGSLVRNLTKNPRLDLAIDFLCKHDEDFFRDLAEVRKQKGDDTYERAFKNLNGHFEKNREAFTNGMIDGYQRSFDVDFASNALSEIVTEKSIFRRVAEESLILNYITIRQSPKKEGAKFPINTHTAKAGYVAANANLTDLTSTIEGDNGSITVKPTKFGARITPIEFSFNEALDAVMVSDIIDSLTTAASYGLRDGIYVGTGTAPAPTGLATNATTVAFNGDVSQTLVKMLATVGNLSKGGRGFGNMFAVTNTAGMATLLGEKLVSQSYFNSILGTNGVVKWLGILDVIIDDVIETSGSTPNVSAPLYLGVRGDYAHVVGAPLKVDIDNFGNFDSGGSKARIIGLNNGKPRNNNSFAKTTIPSIY